MIGLPASFFLREFARSMVVCDRREVWWASPWDAIARHGTGKPWRDDSIIQIN
jgi:hypothetical protein